MLENLITQITAHPYFQQLKNVIENIEGFHDHESVYDHCLKTARIATTQREGNFITDPKAKQLFQKWTEEKIDGIQRKDILVLAALLHDCARSLRRIAVNRGVLARRPARLYLSPAQKL